MPIPGNVFQPVAPIGEPMDVSDAEDSAVRYDDLSVFNVTFDVDQYIAGYTGYAKLQRLIYIADHCPPLRYESLILALQFVKEQTFNVSVYQQVHLKLQQLGNSETNGLVGEGLDSRNHAAVQIPAYDAQWAEQTTKKAAMKLEKLDTDLKHYKSNSIKESIRRGQDDLGEHYLDMGDLANALKCFSRARDYCTTNKHIITMCFNVIKVSVYLSNWPLVLSYVSRAEGLPDLSQPPKDATATSSRQQSLSKLKCAAGLAELANRKYKNAARNFLQANLDYLEYPEIISHSNVATYGTLCALATFDRQELQRSVISNTNFKQFLELEPQLSDIIYKFYESKYAHCLKLLEEIKDNLLVDLYLASHVDTLYTMIRNRGLVQYFSPYLSADLNKMAIAFNTTVNALEDELMRLILEGQVKARIDSHNKVLYAKDIDQRTSTFERVLQVGAACEERTKAAVFRAAMHRAHIFVKCPPRPERSGENVQPSPHMDMAFTPTHSSRSSPIDPNI